MTQVTFWLIVAGENWRVTFKGDKIRIVKPDGKKIIRNNFKRPRGGRPYWPCMGHCDDLIRTVKGKPATTLQAKNRAEKLAKDNKKTLGLFQP